MKDHSRPIRMATIAPMGCSMVDISPPPSLYELCSVAAGGHRAPGGGGHLPSQPSRGAGPHGQVGVEHGALLPLHEGGPLRSEPLNVQGSVLVLPKNQ